MIPTYRYPITFLPCKNLSDILHFYRDILGLEIALEQGQCVIFKIGRSPHISYWGFCAHYDEFVKPAKRVCLTLVVDSPDEVIALSNYLKEKKIECYREAQSTPQFKIFNTFFTDPMGYTIEIQSFNSDGLPMDH